MHAQKLSTILAAVTLMAVPSYALAGKPEHAGGNGSSPHATTPTPAPGEPTPAATTPGKSGEQHPGPKASGSEKAKAYGKHCQSLSKKHSKGSKGTPFSQCVTAMAKLASGDTKSPAKACKGLSKKKAAGQKRTPYSACVKAAAQLKKSTPTPTPVASPAPTPAASPEATPTPTPAATASPTATPAA